LERSCRQARQRAEAAPRGRETFGCGNARGSGHRAVLRADIRAEIVDLFWETDELRRERPTTTDEASAVNYYLEELSRNVVPSVIDDFVVQLHTLGIDVPATARPLRFASSVGGDRDANPYVTPAVTEDVLVQQRTFGIRNLIGRLDTLITASARRPRYRASRAPWRRTWPAKPFCSRRWCGARTPTERRRLGAGCATPADKGSRSIRPL
jgi:phosphoenolpyruvate carboxylase